MYRVVKALNHNVIIVLEDNTKRRLVIYKGIGFQKKPSQRIEIPEDATLYALEELTERGDAMSIVNQVDSLCLEIANAILDACEKSFGTVDRSIVFSMADHLSFAFKRMKEGKKISNPLKDDIRLLFHAEYKLAERTLKELQDSYPVALCEDEISFLALHVHASIENEHVSQSLRTAQIVRSCIAFIEEQIEHEVEVTSLGYNRLMNHIRYMLKRIELGEVIKMNLNDYIQERYPEMFHSAEEICEEISRILKKPYHASEIGYLAMHIARVMGLE